MFLSISGICCSYVSISHRNMSYRCFYLYSWISKQILIFVDNRHVSHSHFPTPHFYYLPTVAWGQPYSLFSCRKKLCLSVPFTRWPLSQSTDSAPDFLLLLAPAECPNYYQTRITILLLINVKETNPTITFITCFSVSVCFCYGTSVKGQTLLVLMTWLRASAK